MFFNSSNKSSRLALPCALGACVAGCWLIFPSHGVVHGHGSTAAPITAGWPFGGPSAAPVEADFSFLPTGLAMTRSRVAPTGPALQTTAQVAFLPTTGPSEAELAAVAEAETAAYSEFVAARKQTQPKWTYVDKTVRSAITAALENDNSRHWNYVVLHSSATASGNARAFDYYHRKVKGMEHGLAYHFVITNGAGGPDGQIQIGPRWMNQQPGGHLRSETQNEVAIGICFVGNFQTDKPTNAQLRAADELIGYLQAKLGKIPVTTHRKINVAPTLCPGKYFPASLFVE